MARHPSPASFSGLLSRLARDRGGNTLMLVAAALLPLLGMLGGGVDMGRAYVTQTRLQQACDAAVLAARKKLGSDLPPSNQVIGQVQVVGNKFFNLNFERGRYGTTGRSFQMTLEADYAISGTASVDLPTTIMGIFGFQDIPIDVECQARMNFTNLDIMMVLDTTGSMADSNPGDAMSRMDSMRAVIRNFHRNVEETKTPDTRIRYGFVPFAAKVNVGHLLNARWIADTASYSSRRSVEVPGETTTTSNTTWTYVSGNRSETTYTAAACPAWAATWETLSTNTSGSTTTVRERGNGTEYHCNTGDGGTIVVREVVLDNYVQDKATTTSSVPKREWAYDDYPEPSAPFKTGQRLVNGRITRQIGGSASAPANVDAWFTGCIEERGTYEIDDYDNVDLSRAVDLDLDRIPSQTDPATQWKLSFDVLSHVRGLQWNGAGSPQSDPVNTGADYVNAGWMGQNRGFGWMSYSRCPEPARALATMDGPAMSAYLNTLRPGGYTHPDIGMIWGGRMLSPTGLFASANADVSANKPTSRHLIFLTDGQTQAYDIANSAYGVDGVHRRRWTPGGATTLNETVEARFRFVCNEIKKRNVTIWVIAFGTELNTSMTQCAGDGHYFEAGDAAQLDEAFLSIAQSLGDLRISE